MQDHSTAGSLQGGQKKRIIKKKSDKSREAVDEVPQPGHQQTDCRKEKRKKKKNK